MRSVVLTFRRPLAVIHRELEQRRRQRAELPIGTRARLLVDQRIQHLENELFVAERAERAG